MLTVGMNQAEVERRLVAGELRCPGCGGVLARWGFARRRVLRKRVGSRAMRPRRGCCGACGATHVLLPADALLRRADTVDVIGSALAAKAAGQGARAIAERLGRVWETVRGWLRAFAAKAEAVRAWCTRLLCQVAVDPVVPQAKGSLWADAVASIAAMVAAVADRFAVIKVTGWRVVAAACHGRLLAPGWPPESINTSRPLARPM